jgi:hypothetical protein
VFIELSNVEGVYATFMTWQGHNGSFKHFAIDVSELKYIKLSFFDLNVEALSDLPEGIVANIVRSATLKHHIFG